MNPVIKVVGVGGSGGNTISRIVSLGETRRGAAKSGGVELIAVNTDAQALHFCKVEKKILIGQHVTRGLGAGMDLELGKVAAQENKKELEEVLKGTDMVFITCGLGGGTGSGATPVIAEIAYLRASDSDCQHRALGTHAFHHVRRRRTLGRSL